MPRRSSSTPVAFGAAMALGAVGGFIGAFFALPIAATIQAFLSTYSKGYAVTDSAPTHVDVPAAAPPESGRRRRRHGQKPDADGTPDPGEKGATP